MWASRDLLSENGTFITRSFAEIMSYLYRLLSRAKFSPYFYRLYRSIKALHSVCRSSGQGPTVVFNLARSYFYPAIFFESILALNLSRFGAKSHVLIDDGVLRHHDTDSCESLLLRDDFKFRMKAANAMLSSLPMFRKYSQFLNEDAIQDVRSIAESLIKNNHYLHSGIDLRPYVDASVIRFFKSAPGAVKDETEYSTILLASTENALISLLLAAQVDQHLQPDIVVTSHGIYSTWGPFYEYFRQKGTRVITYGFSAYKNTGVILSQTGLAANRCDDGFLAAYEHNGDICGVTDQQVHTVLDERFAGQSADLSLFGASEKHDEELKIIQQRTGGRDIFALFPNVLWDNSLTGADRIFPSSIEWIISTVRFFEKQADKVLLIRVHPAERSWADTRVNITSVLEKELNCKVDQLKNTIVIPAESLINSYSILPIMKGGVVYNGTIGLEIMYHRKPLILAGRAPYSDHGFALEFNNADEYFRAFDETERIVRYQEDNRGVMFKFLSFFFVLNDIPLSFYREDSFHKPKLNMKPQDILRDRNLEHICETILGRRRFFQEWVSYEA